MNPFLIAFVLKIEKTKYVPPVHCYVSAKLRIVATTLSPALKSVQPPELSNVFQMRFPVHKALSRLLTSI
jgi:hypothetical protein